MIALITDYGKDSVDVGIIKIILRSNDITSDIIDLTHDISLGNLRHVAYFIEKSIIYLPENSVILVGVNANYHPNFPPILIEYAHIKILTADNGLFHLLDENPTKKAYSWNVSKVPTSLMLSELVPKAVELLKGRIADLFPYQPKFELRKSEPVFKQSTHTLIGHIFYIDNFGNAVSNIHKKVFEQFFSVDNKIEVFANHYRFSVIYNYYDEWIWNVSDNTQSYHGRAYAMFNELGYLQIIIYKSNLDTVGGASSLLGLKEGSEIRVSLKS